MVLGFGYALKYQLGNSAGVYSVPSQVGTGALNDFSTGFVCNVSCGGSMVVAISSTPFVRVIYKGNLKRKFLVEEETTCKDVLVFCKVAWGINSRKSVLVGKSGRAYSNEPIKELISQGINTLFLEETAIFYRVQSHSGLFHKLHYRSSSK